MIGFGHIAEPDFYTHFPAMLPRSSRPRAAWGTGVYPSKQYFDIKMRCLRQRRHRRRWYLKGADNTPYEKIGDEVRSLADEVPFDIPDSWEWVRLGELFQHNTGKALNAANRTGQLKQYITTSNLYWDRFELNNLKEMHFSESEVEKCTVIKGDLLVCEGGDIGRAAIWPFDYPMCIQNHIHRLRAYVPICTRFFYYLFDLYKHAGWIGGKGIGIQGLSSNAIHSLLFPLPPLAEQYRIVDAIVTLQPYTDAYADVESTLDILNTAFPERLKKSILQEAVQGKLVPQDPSDEPAEALLERIRVEKQRLIKEGKIKKNKHESVIFRRDNSHYEKRGSEEDCIDDEIPFEIPESWAWARLSSFGVFSSGKTPSMSNPQFWNGNVPWVTSKDMKRPVITDSEMHISELAAATMQLYPAGTLLLVARSGILKRLLPLCKLGIDSTINQDIKAFSLYDIKLSEWLFYGIKAFEPFILKELVKSVTTVESLKFDEFAAMLIPVPPLSEQRRIIDAIKTAMNLLTPLSSNPLFSL